MPSFDFLGHQVLFSLWLLPPLNPNPNPRTVKTQLGTWLHSLMRLAVSGENFSLAVILARLFALMERLT